MTKEEIADGNKLITEFMRLEEAGPGFPAGYWIDEKFVQYHELKYHLSWEWIMPVIHKIVQNPVNISTRIHRIWVDTFRCKKNFPDKEFDYKIRIHSDFRDVNIKINSNDELEGTWLAAVEFINWYNQQPK